MKSKMPGRSTPRPSMRKEKSFKKTYRPVRHSRMIRPSFSYPLNSLYLILQRFYNTNFCFISKWMQKHVQNFFSTMKIGTTHNKVLCYHFIRHPNTLDSILLRIATITLKSTLFFKGVLARHCQ